MLKFKLIMLLHSLKKLLLFYFPFNIFNCLINFNFLQFALKEHPYLFES